jgi:hypothetical protein
VSAEACCSRSRIIHPPIAPFGRLRQALVGGDERTASEGMGRGARGPFIKVKSLIRS